MDSTRISIARILALGVPLTWQDAVAVAQEAAMLSDVNAAMNSRPSLVTPETCFITSAGDLELPETTDLESPDAVAELLRAMLGDSDAPEALRTLAADTSSPDLSSELRAFAVGNRRTAIAQLAARALTLAAPRRATPKPSPAAPAPAPTPTPEPPAAPPPAISTRRWAPMAPSAQPAPAAPAVAVVAAPAAATMAVAAAPAAAPDVELRRLRQRAVERDKRNPARARFARFLPTRANLPGPRAIGGAIVAVAAVAAVSAIFWPLVRPYVNARTATSSVAGVAQAAAVAPATTTDDATVTVATTPSPAASVPSVPVGTPVAAVAARTSAPSDAANRAKTTPLAETQGGTVAVLRSASSVSAGAAARPAAPPAIPGASRATMSAAPSVVSPAAVAAPPPAVPAVSSAPTLAARPGAAPAEPSAALASPPPAPVAAPSVSRPPRPAAGTVAGRGGRAIPYSASDADVAPPTLRSQQLPSSVLDPGPDAPIDGPFLTVLIDEHGAVERVRLHAKAPPSGQTLYRHRMMVAAAKAWRFEPARRQGEAVRYVLRVPLEP